MQMSGHPESYNPMPLLRSHDPSIDYNEMEKNLAVQMARMKSQQLRRDRELMQMAAESFEIKQLKHEIEAAKLNQERAIQVAES